MASGGTVSTCRDALNSLVQTIYVGVTNSVPCMQTTTRRLRFEGLEPRLALTTLMYTPSLVADPTWTPDSSVTDWVDESTGFPSAWQQNAVAEFPPSAAGPVALSYSALAGLPLIYASEIIIDDGSEQLFLHRLLRGALEIPATGTTIQVGQNSPHAPTATISLPVVSQGTAGVVTTTGPGTLVIGAGSTATFDSITVGQNSGDAGVLRVDGTLNIAANGVLDVASSTAFSGAGND